MGSRSAARVGGRIAALGVLAGGAVAVLLLARGPGSEPGTAPLPPPTGAPPESVPAPVDGAPLPPLPASLRDTGVDGALPVDAQGRFVPGPEALALFDYFLSATGEEPDAVIRARIVAHARGALPPEAAREAEALLDTYLRYREHMRALTARGEPPEDLERRFQWIREERRRIFGAGLAAALFAEEEQVVTLDLERRRVAQDGSLSAAEKARRLDALEARLPERVREARREASAPARVAREVDALREAGAGDAEVFAVRQRAFGAEAAERLATLDREQAAFQAKLAAHAADRERLLADPALSAGEREARLEALRAARFTESERIRVRALDAGQAASR